MILMGLIGNIEGKGAVDPESMEACGHKGREHSE